MADFKSPIVLSLEQFTTLSRVDKVVWNNNSFECVVIQPPSTTPPPNTTTTPVPTTTINCPQPPVYNPPVITDFFIGIDLNSPDTHDPYMPDYPAAFASQRAARRSVLVTAFNAGTDSEIEARLDNTQNSNGLYTEGIVFEGTVIAHIHYDKERDFHYKLWEYDSDYSHLFEAWRQASINCTSSIPPTTSTITPTTSTTQSPTTSTVAPTTSTTLPPTTQLIKPVIQITGFSQEIPGLSRGYVEFSISKNSASSIGVNCSFINNSNFAEYHDEQVYRKACREGAFNDVNANIGQYYPEDNLNGIVRPLYDNFFTGNENVGIFRYYFFNPGNSKTKELQILFRFDDFIDGITELTQNITFNSINSEIEILSDISNLNSGDELEVRIDNFATSLNNGINSIDEFSGFSFANLGICYSNTQNITRHEGHYVFASETYNNDTGRTWHTWTRLSDPDIPRSFEVASLANGPPQHSQFALTNAQFNSATPSIGKIGRRDLTTIQEPLQIARPKNEITVVNHRTIIIKLKISNYFESTTFPLTTGLGHVSSDSGARTESGASVGIINSNKFIKSYNFSFRLYLKKIDAEITSQNEIDYVKSNLITLQDTKNYSVNPNDDTIRDQPFIYS